MAYFDNQEESCTISELLDKVDSFPAIAEVDQDHRDVTVRSKLLNGTLLWILRRCQDEATGCNAVRVATFQAPAMEFPIILQDVVMVYRRRYHQVALRMNQPGPSMDINQVANLAFPGYPVFVAATEDQNRRECTLIHEKRTIYGYLAKGRQNYLFIPTDCEGKFVKTASTVLPKFETVSEISNMKWMQDVKVLNCGMIYSPVVDNIYDGDILKLLDSRKYTVEGVNTLLFERTFSKIGKIGHIRVAADIKGEFHACESADDVFLQQTTQTLQEFDRQQFPVDVSFVSDMEGVQSFVMSFHDEILSKESPMTVFGQCSYTSAYISIHTLDPFHDKSVVTRMVSEFTAKKVKVRSPMPVHIRDILNFQKPCTAVRALTPEEVDQLRKTVTGIGRDRLTTYPLPGNRTKSPVTRRRLQTTGTADSSRYGGQNEHPANGGSPSNGVSHGYVNYNPSGSQRSRPVPAPRVLSDSSERNLNRPVPQPPTMNTREFSGSLPDLHYDERKQDSIYMTMKRGSFR